MNRALLKMQLVRHEGLRRYPYTDTVGKLTIGVGRNLTDRGLSEGEIQVLLENDILAVEHELVAALPWIATLSEVRLRVLLNMGFNLGVPGLLKFKETLAAVRDGYYALAAERMLQSKWAGQVGRRATELAEMMKTGVDPK